MINTKEQLQNLVEDLILQKEKELDHLLPTNDAVFLRNVCVEFVADNIHKFVAGGKEHNSEHDGTFLTNVNHKSELWKEILDFANYLKALDYKKLPFNKEI